jgi:DNA excision repair protein ERCC-2
MEKGSSGVNILTGSHDSPCMDYSIFPYGFRKNQKQILDIINNAVQKGNHLVLESKTGSGKTVCALVPTLQYALENDKKVLYLTRTNSQQRQVIYELRKVNSKKKVMGVGVQGRHQMCPSLKSDSRLAEGSADELSKICGKRKMEVLKAISQGSNPTSCKYFAKVCTGDIGELKKWSQKNLPTVEELVKWCEKEGFCPYEVNKSLISDADLICAPYIYFFNKFIRTRLLEWMGCNLGDIILVVDEAHNLPAYAREIESMELGTKTLDMAKKEAVEFGNLRTSDGLFISEFSMTLKEIFRTLQRDYLPHDTEDAFIPPGEFLSELMHTFSSTSRKLKAQAADLVIHGEIIREVRLKDGKLPRSYIHSLGGFLSFWMEQQDENFVRLIHDHENPKLEIFCLEPAYATSVVLDCHSSIHMSGTLTPLEEYRDSIGLPSESELAAFPSPFPPANRVVYYVEDVTTRYEDLTKDTSIVPKMEDYLINISCAFSKNTAFFFPSFRLLDNFLKDGLAFSVDKRCFVEKQGMTQPQLMDLVEHFKSNYLKGSVLLSVVGGRLSEGMDYPAEQLEILIIVGIPYPRPSAKQRALEIFYDRKYNKGWEYAVKAPTTRRLLQTLGRLIRDENDKGVAIILDRRAPQFKEFIPDLKLSNDIIGDCKEFF